MNFPKLSVDALATLDMDMMSTPIQDHPEYPDIIAAIERWGGAEYYALVMMAHDESGESHTHAELWKMSRGKLLAIIIDQLWEELGEEIPEEH